MKFLIVEASSLPFLIPFGPKYSPRVLFTNTLTPQFSLNVRGKIVNFIVL